MLNKCLLAHRSILIVVLVGCVHLMGFSQKSMKISESKFVTLNGIDQWITIKGDRSRPVILFLHGGPGSVLSCYSDNLYKSWEDDFLLVQWDQRGAGRTYGKNAAGLDAISFSSKNILSVEQMTSDGLALAEYLKDYLQKPKIILFGTSWGSVLGMNMALQRPDLFTAYVGHSQIVNPQQALTNSYE